MPCLSPNFRRWLWLCLWPLASLQAAGDDALLTALLTDHVSDEGVDYAALEVDPRLPRYLEQLAATDPATLPDDRARLALWINAYNAYTLKLVADAYPVYSIHDIGSGRVLGWLLQRTPWDIRFARVGGQDYTLNEIEHEILRKQFSEPRLHFAIVCAARSCPPLRREAYAAARLDAQLADQARQFLRQGADNHFDLAARRARLSAIFSWFKDDFGGSDTALLKFIAPYAPPDVSADLAGQAAEWVVEYADYNWALNGRP